MIDRRTVLLGLGLATTAGSQTPPPSLATGPVRQSEPTETIDLWPGGAPGMPGTPPAETVQERSTDPTRNDRAVFGITRPRLVVFRPKRPNGRAALVTPGGGYRWVVVDKEGYEFARWLAARGWTVFVLFYRLPGEGWADRANVPLADAQRAMRVIRHRAGSYGIQSDRIVAVGFSAGGHVCADLATRYDVPTYAPIDAADRLSARPDLAAPIYAVQSMAEPFTHAGSRDRLIGLVPSADAIRRHSPAGNARADMPPLFLVHAEDDTVVRVENSLQMRAAAKAVGVPVNLHLFSTGGHGFGLRGTVGKPVEVWPDLFLRWATSALP